MVASISVLRRSGMGSAKMSVDSIVRSAKAPGTSVDRREPEGRPAAATAPTV